MARRRRRMGGLVSARDRELAAERREMIRNAPTERLEIDGREFTLVKLPGVDRAPQRPR